VKHDEFAKFLWPLLYGVLPSATEAPSQCSEVFSLLHLLLLKLLAENPGEVDTTALVQLCGKLLLHHRSTEV